MDKTNYKEYFQMLFFRFLRGFVASAISSMAIIVTTYVAQNDMGLFPFFQALGVSALFGGISGGILALDKALRTDIRQL